jgi:hypothetical protein
MFDHRALKFVVYKLTILVTVLLFSACGGNNGNVSSNSLSSNTSSSSNISLGNSDSSVSSSESTSSSIYSTSSSSSIANQVNVVVNFPTAISMVGKDNITIYGSADSSGKDIGLLTVNGVAATTLDNFANWKATVPLVIGYNTLQIDVDGINAAHIVVRRYTTRIPPEHPERQQSFYYEPQGLVLNKLTSQLLWIDKHHKALVGVDVNTGVGSIIFSNISNIITPTDLVLDSTNNKVFVTDSGSRAVLEIDLSNGSRRIVSAQGIPDNANLLINPQALVLDSSNNRILVVDSNSVIAVNLDNGVRTFISSILDSGIGTEFMNPTDMILDQTNQRVIITDYDTGSLVAVGLINGARENLASGVNWATDLVLDTDGERVFVLSSRIEIAVVNPISEASITSVNLDLTKEWFFTDFGPKWYIDFRGDYRDIWPHAKPTGMALDSQNRRLFVVDEVNGVFVVQLDSLEKAHLFN